MILPFKEETVEATWRPRVMAMVEERLALRVAVAVMVRPAEEKKGRDGDVGGTDGGGAGKAGGGKKGSKGDVGGPGKGDGGGAGKPGGGKKGGGGPPSGAAKGEAGGGKQGAKGDVGGTGGGAGGGKTGTKGAEKGKKGKGDGGGTGGTAAKGDGGKKGGKKGAGGKKGDDAFAQGLVTNTRKGDGKAGPGFVQIVHLGSLSRYSMQKNEILDDCGASVTAVNAVAGLLDFEEAGSTPSVQPPRLALPMLAKIHVTHTVTGDGGLSDLCEGILKPGSRGLIYIDEPTTKAKVVLDDMEATFKTVTKNVSPDLVSFGVCCGRRFDLLGLVTAKMKTLAPTREIFVVTCTAGNAQSKNKKATYFVWPGGIKVKGDFR
eukprot:s4245_g4.t1